MSELHHALVFTFASLFSMANPVGMAPVFLEKTAGEPDHVRHALAWRVGLYGIVLLVVAMFAGPALLRFFGVSLPDIQVAGGLFVFYTAWSILLGPRTATTSAATPPAESPRGMDMAFFPLTMPLTAGAGSLAVAMSLSSKIAHAGNDIWAGYAGAVLGICLVLFCVALCYRFADAIFARLGRAGTQVATRLTAFFLLAIGVEVTWGGLKPLILSLHS